MMKSKFTDQIKDKRRIIADRILIIQAPILLIILVLISNTKIIPQNSIDFLMLFWFYCSFLKGYRLLQDISIIESNIVNDIKDKPENVTKNYRRWEFYRKAENKKSIPISIFLAAFVIFSIAFHVSINIFKGVFLLILFVDITVFSLGRLSAVNKFIKYNLRVYTENAGMKLGKCNIAIQNKPYFLRKLLEGFVVGLSFLFVVYYFLEIPVLHYFLYYFAFGILYSLSRILISTYGFLGDALNVIDSIRLGPVEMKSTEK